MELGPPGDFFAVRSSVGTGRVRTLADGSGRALEQPATASFGELAPGGGAETTNLAMLRDLCRRAS